MKAHEYAVDSAEGRGVEITGSYGHLCAGVAAGVIYFEEGKVPCECTLYMPPSALGHGV